jgi:sporulation protein YlmC with PRC-barrel domain
MKRSLWVSAVVVSLVTASQFGWQSLAHAQVDVDAGPVRVKVGEDASPAATKGLAFRASTLTGMTVKNAAGKDLGTINDLVIDANTGKLRYAAVAYGGFLGVGDKLFAIPWSKFAVAGTTGDRYLVLNVDIETLKNAPGFDQDNWPDTADTAWAKQIDDYYHEKIEKDRPLNPKDIKPAR